MIRYTRRFLDDHQVQRRWIDPRMHAVRVNDVRNYLLRKGWKEAPPDLEGWVVFQEPQVGEADPLYQWLPNSEQRREYPQAVYELLAAVAEIENRTAVEVLTDVLATGTPEQGTATQRVG